MPEWLTFLNGQIRKQKKRNCEVYCTLSLGQIDQVYFQKLHNLYSMAKIIFYFYYDKNLKDSHGRPITKEKQRDNYKKQLQNLFGLKSDIKIKEW